MRMALGFPSGWLQCLISRIGAYGVGVGGGDYSDTLRSLSSIEKPLGSTYLPWEQLENQSSLQHKQASKHVPEPHKAGTCLASHLCCKMEPGSGTFICYQNHWIQWRADICRQKIDRHETECTGKCRERAGKISILSASSFYNITSLWSQLNRKRFLFYNVFQAFMKWTHTELSTWCVLITTELFGYCWPLHVLLPVQHSEIKPFRQAHHVDLYPEVFRVPLQHILFYASSPTIALCWCIPGDWVNTLRTCPDFEWDNILIYPFFLIQRKKLHLFHLLGLLSRSSLQTWSFAPGNFLNRNVLSGLEHKTCS